MDCARFEHAITRRLTGSPVGEDPSIAELDAHASGCASCRGAADLLRLAEVDPAERFPFAEPGPEDWAAIDGRLAARLAEERGGGRRGGLTALAASVAAVLVCGLMLAGSSWSVRPPVVPAIADTAVASGIPASNEDRVWDAAGVTSDGFDWADPTHPGEGRSAPVPDLGTLDDRERQELLEWIRDEMTRIEGDTA